MLFSSVSLLRLLELNNSFIVSLPFCTNVNVVHPQLTAFLLIYKYIFILKAFILCFILVKYNYLSVKLLLLKSC